jgi:magnesium-transporting ATPase (P-type)
MPSNPVKHPNGNPTGGAMKIHLLTADEAVRSLRSAPEGLDRVEARRRLLEFGPNRLERARGTPLGVRFLKEFTHFFALILWLAAGLAFAAEWLDPGAGMASLGLAILGVILVNGLFSFVQEYRAERALAALQRLLPHQVKALRDGKVRQVPAEELVPGDVILLDGGDNVPADCRVLEAFGVCVNTATLTGESLPQVKGVCPGGEELLHSRCVLLAGTSLVSGRCRALVFATGAHTEFGQIARLTQDTRQPLSPLQREIERLGHLVAALSLVLGLVFFFIGRQLGLSFWQNFLFAIGIIVANVPEGLLPTITLALAMGSQRMARRKALVRHLLSVETLGSATVICTDKTGTLTQNRMEVRELFLSGQSYDLADGEDLSPLRARAHRPFFEGAWRCHTLKEAEAREGKTVLGDPMEVALVRRPAGYSPPLPGAPASMRSPSIRTAGGSQRSTTRPKAPSSTPRAHWKPSCPCAVRCRRRPECNRSPRYSRSSS